MRALHESRGPADRREAATQTPPREEEQLCHDLYVAVRCKYQALQRSHASEETLAQNLATATERMADAVKMWEERGALLTVMQQSWTQMGLDYKVWRELLAKSHATMEKMKEKVKAAERERSEVCRKLEEQTVELVEVLGRVKQLTEANACLDTALGEALLRATVAERLAEECTAMSQQLVEKEDLLQKADESVARLSRAKELAERENETVRQDLREASDCREFIEQENQILRCQLTEMEEELKSTVVTLWERSAHLEDLKDGQKRLQQERDSLAEQLGSTTAEIQDAETHFAEISEAFQGLAAVQEQFLSIVTFLQAALQGQGDVADAVPRGRPCTPARQMLLQSQEASFVDSVLRAATKNGLQTPGIGSDNSAFVRTTSTVPLKPAELAEAFRTSLLALQKVADQLPLLSTKCQKAAQEEVQDLQVHLLRLESQLQDSESQLQAQKASHEVHVEKLHKELQMLVQNEKQLQEVIWQQDKNLQLQMDQRRDVANLQEEVAQLKLALQKAETEGTTLWQELRESKPLDEDRVQEKVHLRQQVGKLNELLLAKDTEHLVQLNNYLSQVKYLEKQLHQTKPALRRCAKVEAEIKDLLSTFPEDLPNGREHLQRLLLCLE